MKKITTKRLCIIAILTALYFVLTIWLTIRIGNLRISLASLPILILAIMYGPLESAFAAGLGEFLNQLLTYGLTITTPIWILPPIIRALIVAFGCNLIKKKYSTEDPWSKPVLFYGLLIIAAIITTFANTGVTWLDSIIFHYYTFAYVFGDFVIRLVTGVLTAVVMATILPYIIKPLRKVAF